MSIVEFKANLEHPSATSSAERVEEQVAQGLELSSELRLTEHGYLGSSHLLSREEERELGLSLRRARDLGESEVVQALREKFIAHNIGLVCSIANTYTFGGVETSDLIQYGLVGLGRAVDGWNPESKNKFSTYATPAIKREINRALTREGHLIKVPSHAGKVMAEIANTDGEIDVDAVVARTGSSVQTVRHTLAVRSALPHSIGGPEDGVSEYLAGQDAPIVAVLANSEELEMLKPALQALPELTRNLIELHFGLGTEPPMNFKECGRATGMDSRAAARLIRQGLETLRQELKLSA